MTDQHLDLSLHTDSTWLGLLPVKSSMHGYIYDFIISQPDHRNAQQCPNVRRIWHLSGIDTNILAHHDLLQCITSEGHGDKWLHALVYKQPLHMYNQVLRTYMLQSYYHWHQPLKWYHHITERTHDWVYWPQYWQYFCWTGTEFIFQNDGRPCKAGTQTCRIWAQNSTWVVAHGTTGSLNFFYFNIGYHKLTTRHLLLVSIRKPVKSISGLMI